MYGWRNLAEKSPTTIVSAVTALVNFIAGCVFYARGVEASAGFGALVLMGETALLVMLNLFVVQPNTVTKAQASDQQATAVAARDVEVMEFLATAEPPKVDEKVAKKVAGTAKKARARAAAE